MKFRVISTFICLLCTLSSFAQKKTNVILEQCEELTFDKEAGRPYQVLRGNVRFRHDDVLMYCDSAYFYDGSNSFDAFGHVKMLQGDTLSLVSDIVNALAPCPSCPYQ